MRRARAPPELLDRELSLPGPSKQQTEVESHRLALAGPLHERAEPGERRIEVVHVEPADRRGDLRVGLVRMQARRLRVEALGGVLVELALLELTLDEQWIVALVLNDG